MPKLRGMKAIADHFDVSRSTVQKWIKLHGLPVARLPGSNRVVADTEKLDTWWQKIAIK